MSLPRSSLTLCVLLTIGTFEGLFAGAFFILCFTALFLLANRSPHLSRKRLLRRSWLFTFLKSPLVFGSIIISLGIFVHWMLTIYRTTRAISLIATFTNPFPFLVDISQRSWVTGTIFIAIPVVATDCLLIWRLWAVSGKNTWVILLPCFTALGFTACAIRIILAGALASPGTTFYTPELDSFITANIILPTITNLYCSVVLAICIYRVVRSSAQFDSSSLRYIQVLVVESAAVWSLWTMGTLICYQLSSPFALLGLDCGPAVAGISFMLINVRIGLGWDARPLTAHGDSILPSFNLKLDDNSVYPLQIAISIKETSLRAQSSR